MMQLFSAGAARAPEIIGHLRWKRWCSSVPSSRIWIIFAVNIVALFMWWYAILEMDVEVSDRYSRNRWKTVPNGNSTVDIYVSPFRKGQAASRTYVVLWRISILFHLCSTFSACVILFMFRIIVLRSPQRLCMYCEVAKVGFSVEDVNKFQKRVQLLCIVACVVDAIGWIFDMELIYGTLSSSVTASLKKAQVAYHVSNLAMLLCHTYGAMATIMLPKAFYEELKPALKTYCFHCLYPVKLTVD